MSKLDQTLAVAGLQLLEKIIAEIAPDLEKLIVTQVQEAISNIADFLNSLTHNDDEDNNG